MKEENEITLFVTVMESPACESWLKAKEII